MPRVNREERMVCLATHMDASFPQLKKQRNLKCSIYLSPSPRRRVQSTPPRAPSKPEVASEMESKLFGLGRPRADAPLKVGPVQAEILQVIRDHVDIAYGVGIAGYLRDHRGHDVSDAQTYIALRRLDARGLIAERSPETEKQNTPSDSRRGRPHKFYTLTASGKRALQYGGGAANSKAGSDAQMEGRFHGAKEEGPAPVVG